MDGIPKAKEETAYHAANYTWGKVSFGITNALSVILEFGIDSMTAMKAGLGREVIRRIATGN